MASYKLHLGFDWNSPIIGSIWGSPGTTSYRFLQYALEGASDPAWFQFQVNDTVSIVMWDLTSEPVAGTPALDLAFSPLDAVGGAPTTLAPSTLVDYGVGIATSASTDQGNNYLAFTSINTVTASQPAQGPWSESRTTYNAGPLAFNTKEYTTYKVSFRLAFTARQTGETKVFISDPEVIVGSRGG